MTGRYLLAKDHLVPLLRKIAKSNRLVAPVLNEYGDTLFSHITDLDSAAIDLAHQPQNSLKSFFFPQTEKLSTYLVEKSPKTGNVRYNFYPHTVENQPTAYVGVRSCDMFAVMYTDMTFLHNGERDNYYQKRRDNAFFITLACNHPFPNCFCNATRSGPFLELGYDLQLTDLGDRYFVETGRSRGMKIVEQMGQFFKPASEADRREQFQLALEARGLFQRNVHVELASKILQEQDEPVGIISELSSRCQDCAGCAYVCPTCTCFNIADLPLDEESGERIRSWDACTFAGFSKMAGDHNPVQCESQRVRKRFLHKLLHDVAKHGRPSCVGCGRCVDICFGGVDIISFVDRVVKTIDHCRDVD